MGSYARGAGAAVRLERPTARPPAGLELDAQQRAVVGHRDGHLLVLAGPGTGKTTTLAELVVARIQDPTQSLAPSRILALTFGRRAAGELSERISARLGGGPVPVVSTFHSFAYGAVRAHSDPTAFASLPRLLVAAEQEARLRELLTHSIEEGRLRWPESLARAVGTRGIAEQVRALLARARGQGLDGRDLTRIGRRDGVPVWAALGGFLEEYLTTLEFEGSLDYSELMLRAAVLAHDPRAGRGLRSAYDLVVVDEYQDTDPAQVALLRGLAGGGAQVVAVGDPDQAIYGFRGADVRGILHFPDVFADPSGRPAHVEVLRTSRRFPLAIAEAAAGVLGPVSLAPLPARVQRLHRSPVALTGPAQVDVRTFPSAAAQASAVAEELLRAHAGDGEHAGLDWSQMAVLVRSPALHGPVLTRALRAAGIPVWLAPDETALADEPSVTTMLDVVGLATDPDSAAEDVGRSLLVGPLGRADAVGVRALARALLVEHRRSLEAAAGSAVEGEPPLVAGPADLPGAGGQSAQPSRMAASRVTSDALLTAALSGQVGQSRPRGVPESAWVALRQVQRCVAAAGEALAAGQMVSDVLWALWRATDWPERLRSAALRPGAPAAATAAHRDLDALVALFELAERLPPQRAGRVGMAAFLDDVAALRLPQQVSRAPESDRDHVRLLSAHRAKGLQWQLVVVASVQEGQWPDVRLRSDLLHVDELGRSGRIEGLNHADLLAEERRLMYVACTRARSTLLVTAVAERVEGGLQASRFLPEIGTVQAMPARSSAPMSAEGLITALREAAHAPPLTPDHPDHQRVEQLRAAATERLAALARRAEGGGALGPLAAADPTRWWGALPLTKVGVAGGTESGPREPAWPLSRAERLLGGERLPVSLPRDNAGGDDGNGRSADDPPIRLSPSAVAALLQCPLRWFLDRRVGAGSPSGGAATVGLIVHTVAEALARGDLTEEREIGPFLDEIWPALPFPARYERTNERRRVEEMIAALLRWQNSSGRTPLATELAFQVSLDEGGPPVRISGAMDRVDVAPDGAVHIVDFKTSKAATSEQAAADHPQLGLYQWAVGRGALAEVPGAPTQPRLGGAELVFVGDRFADGSPKVRSQPPLEQGRTWVDDLVVEAGRLAAGPDYPARVNGSCGRCAYRYLCPAQAPAASGQPTPADAQTEPRPPEHSPRTETPAANGGPQAEGQHRTSPDPESPHPRAPDSSRSPERATEPVQQSLWGDDL